MAKVTNRHAGPGGKLLDIGRLHDAAFSRLEPSYRNVALVTSFKQDRVAEDAAGDARKAQDPPAGKMMPVLRTMNCASNSKVITTAAVLRQLWLSGEASLSTPMHRYLPRHWTVHPAVKKITFAHLLGYRSGLSRNASATYSDMKDVVASKPSTALGVRKYKRIDHALCRLLLPGLAGFRFGATRQDFFENENRYLSEKHRELVQALVFSRVGIQAADLKSKDENEMLRYDVWNSKKKGRGNSNYLLTAGSTGWFLDCRQLARFYSRLWFTSNVLPQWIRDKMFDDVLGYDSTGTVSGVGYATKGGRSHGGSWAYFSRFVGFKNGVTMVVYSNSGVRDGWDSAEPIIKDEFAKWYV